MHLKKSNEFLQGLGDKVIANVGEKMDKIVDKSHRVVLEQEVNELIRRERYSQAIERVLPDPELLIITLQSFEIESLLESGLLSNTDLIEMAKSLSQGINLITEHPSIGEWLLTLEEKIFFTYSNYNSCGEIVRYLDNFSGPGGDKIIEIRNRYNAKRVV
jgi:hypothetical protein